MKIRMDFVTNSSSTGYVVISLKLKSGDEISIEKDYDSGYGGYVWNNDSMNFDMGFDAAKSGKDILDVMRRYIEDFDKFVLYGSEGDHFKREIEKIGDPFSSVESIKMYENTHYDEGSDQSINYKYVFKKKKPVRFAAPEEVTPSLNTECCVYGDFAIGNENGDYKKVVEVIESHKWHFNRLFVNALNQFKRPYNDVKYDYRLFIIGDLTAEKIEEVGFEQYAQKDVYIKVAIALQKKKHFLFIKESDFISLGECKIPFNKCPKIEAGSELVFSPCGKWYVSDEDYFRYIFNCGLRVTADAKEADVLIVPDDYYQSVVDYGQHYSDYDCSLHKAFYFAQIRGKNRPLVVTESDFTASTEELRKQGRLVPENSLDCSGKTFMVALLGKEKTKAIDYICSNGGSVVESKAKHVGVIDVLLYRPDDLYIGNERISAAQKRVNCGENVLLLNFEEFKKAVGIKDDQPKKTSGKTEKDPFNAEDMKKIWKYETVDGGVRITGRKVTKTDAEIPERIGKRPVISIGECAFRYSSLKSVTIPSSVETIENKAFEDCRELTNVVIQSGVKTIGDLSFYECTKLENIIIPPSVTTIGQSAFAGCCSLKDLTIPEGVTSIGACAFRDLSALTVDTTNPVFYSEGNCIIEKATKTVIAGCNGSVIPDDVLGIGNNAFFGCGKLESVTIPNGVKSIGELAFASCKELDSIIIPPSVTNVGKGAFCNLPALTVDTTNPVFYSEGNCIIERATKTVIAGCKGSVIPDDVLGIGAGAFYCCDLTSITIPNGVKSIGNYAFSNCSNLVSVTIPNSVTTLGEYAFDSCYRLSNVSLPDSITAIPDFAFQFCWGLTSVKIPESVTCISENAFKGAGLKYVQIRVELKGKFDSSLFGPNAQLMYY